MPSSNPLQLPGCTTRLPPNMWALLGCTTIGEWESPEQQPVLCQTAPQPNTLCWTGGPWGASQGPGILGLGDSDGDGEPEGDSLVPGGASRRQAGAGAMADPYHPMGRPNEEES
jgi:hypothetical protein